MSSALRGETELPGITMRVVLPTRCKRQSSILILESVPVFRPPRVSWLCITGTCIDPYAFGRVSEFPSPGPFFPVGKRSTNRN
jgi:hypothetical protein